MPIQSESQSPALDLGPQVAGAAARAFIYRFLATVYEYPDIKNWKWLCQPQLHGILSMAVKQAFAKPPSVLMDQIRRLVSDFSPDAFEIFQTGHRFAFGHASRGRCPINEIEYGDIKADPLFQPHRLADLAAFYHAFGLEMTGDASERQDHISIECEFMSVLAAREIFVVENGLEKETLLFCCDIQKKFLREHLGRWIPAFARRLSHVAGGGIWILVADFTRGFVEADCCRLDVRPGNDDLLLRVVDEHEESLCDSCGITNLSPGACATVTER